MSGLSVTTAFVMESMSAGESITLISYDCRFLPLGALMPHFRISFSVSRLMALSLYARMLRRLIIRSVTIFAVSVAVVCSCLHCPLHEVSIIAINASPKRIFFIIVFFYVFAKIRQNLPISKNEESKVCENLLRKQGLCVKEPTFTSFFPYQSGYIVQTVL